MVLLEKLYHCGGSFTYAEATAIETEHMLWPAQDVELSVISTDV